MSDCVVCDITVHVLEYCNVCPVVSEAAHANLCGVDLGHNSAESLQAVIHCEHICGYCFMLNAVIFCGGVIYPLT
jgi:hypothetical protein